MLIIDDIDTILYNRTNAVRSWEVSFTNEFLTQMERFRGILICTTNRLKSLDPASIRRFNHKIEFHYLTDEGNLVFYDRLLSHLVDRSLSHREKAHLESLKNLTPGDFKTVRDKFSFIPKGQFDHASLFFALNEEGEIKKKQTGKVIGFN